MTQRIAGPKGSKRRRGFLIVPMLAVLAVALFFSTGAGAVHDAGVFELDNNALNNALGGAAAGEDWENIAPGGTNTAADAVFKPDRFDENDNTFCAGTKEIHDLDAWKWCQNAASNDRNDLEDAYAAIYTGAMDTPEAGHRILYVGADRFANNGDSGLGFMLLQSTLAESACPVNGTNCVFNDGSGSAPHHQNGDVYVVSQFTGGGQDVTVDFFAWTGQGTANPHWQQLDTSGVDCDASIEGDHACATVFGDGNRSTNLVADAPWTYTTEFPGVDSNGVAQPSDFAEGTFFEGGVDLTAAGIRGCFRTVLIDTSQSQNIDESTQDYVFGAFEGCGLTIDTIPSLTSYLLGSGATINDHAEFAGTGVDTPPTPTGSASFFLCAPNQVAGGSCPDDTGTKVGSDVTLTQKPAGVPQADSADAKSLVTAVGTYCFRVVYNTGTANPNPYAAFDGTSFSDSGECFTVTDTSSGTTAQSWIPNDSATFTSTGGSALAGSVTFKLYAGGICQGMVLYEETISDIATGTGTASSRTVQTTNGDGNGTGLAADLILDVGDSPATVSWQATFTSTSTSTSNRVSGSTTHCERSDLTIDDDITTP
jgi:hypothetical protein